MSFIDCVRSAAAENKVSKETLAEVEKEYKALMDDYAKHLSPTQADAKATKEITEARKATHTRMKQGLMQQALDSKDLMDAIDKNFKQKEEAYAKLNKVQKALTKTPTRADEVMEVLMNADRREETIIRELFSGLHDMVDRYGDNWIDSIKDIASFKQVIGRMIDGDLSDPIAKSMREAMTRSHEMFKQAGGEIGHIENYVMQSHEGTRVAKVPYDVWIKDIENNLDMAKSKVDLRTGLPLSDERWTEITSQIYDDIVSDGRAAINRATLEGRIHKGKAQDTWGSRQQSRIFHFKDSKNYFEYQGKYGIDDRVLFSQYANYLRGMSRDIAMMQTMTRSPHGMMQTLKQFMAGEDEPLKKAWTENAFEVLSGATDTGEASPLYRSLMGVQHLMRSSMLGSAPISAVSDATMVKLAADKFGLQGNRAVKNLLTSSANKKNRQITSNNAFVVESALGSGISHYRLNEGNSFIDGGNMLERGLQWTSKTLHRLSGLRAITNAAGDSVSMELAGTLGDAVSKGAKWKGLNKTFRQSLTDHGLTEADWDIVLKAEVLSPEQGTRFVTPESIAKIKDVPAKEVLEVSRKVSDIDVFLRYQATTSPSLKVRAISTWGAKQGTTGRAVASSVSMFKSFPMGLMFNQLLPAVSRAAQGDVKPLATLMIGTTLLGAVALQLKDVAKGREPRDMNDPRFWIAASMQGGGYGPFGDLLFTEHGRFGRSFMTGVLGPVAGFTDDTLGLVAGHLQQAILDPEYKAQEKFLKDMSGFMRRYTPAATLWYSRVAMERMLFDSMDRMALPDFDAQMRAKKDKFKKDFGSDHWWNPGDLTPQF